MKAILVILLTLFVSGSYSIKCFCTDCDPENQNIIECKTGCSKLEGNLSVFGKWNDFMIVFNDCSKKRLGDYFNPFIGIPHEPIFSGCAEIFGCKGEREVINVPYGNVTCYNCHKHLCNTGNSETTLSIVIILSVTLTALHAIVFQSWALWNFSFPKDDSANIDSRLFDLAKFHGALMKPIAIKAVDKSRIKGRISAHETNCKWFLKFFGYEWQNI